MIGRQGHYRSPVDTKVWDSHSHVGVASVT